MVKISRLGDSQWSMVVLRDLYNHEYSNLQGTWRFPRVDGSAERCVQSVKSLEIPQGWMAVHKDLCNNTCPSVKELGDSRGLMAVTKDLCKHTYKTPRT